MKKPNRVLDAGTRMAQGFSYKKQAGVSRKNQTGSSAIRFFENLRRASAGIAFAPDTVEKRFRRIHSSVSSRQSCIVERNENAFHVRRI
ncbi:MAG: hypothetical protein IJT94_09805 [Oscillibacter sp.]|nr:hypothetical protein [Oscillibacter sp.]